MNRRHLLTGAAATAAAGMAGGLAFASDLAPGAAREDMRILRAALALHPGLYRYNAAGQIEERLDRLERRFVAAPDMPARFLLLSEFLTTVRCGHTQCNPFNQSDEVVQHLFDRPTRVPFRFTWIDGEMVVLGGGGAELPPGSRVTRLNGERPQHLLRRLLAYARTDGQNTAKQVAQMAMRNTETFETFDIYQGLIAPPRGGAHVVRATRPDGLDVALEAPTLDLAARRAQQLTLDTDGDQPFWTWEVRGDVAVLTMPTWVMYNSAWDWRSWLDERLDSLAGLKGLVIDLRDNEGGNECGNAILARLAVGDLRFAGYQSRVRFRSTPPDLDPYLNTWDNSFRTIGVEARDIGGGFFVLPEETEPTDIIPARGPRITVPVAALVGPVCSSATFSFARRARESGLVRLFGEQTGGNLRGINGSGYFFVQLPGSGLEFDVPLIGFFPLTEQPDRGVDPDVDVRPSAADIAASYDRCMNEAIAWCSASAAQ